jgi:putative endonuclease
MDTKRDTGDQYEALALGHLKHNGLTLIKRNHLCKGGEIDLVMLDGTTLALIEVRFRRNRDYGGAAASVTRNKQRRIMLAARHLLHTRTDLQKYRARFDLVAIELDEHLQPKVEWIKGAFRM